MLYNEEERTIMLLVIVDGGKIGTLFVTLPS